MDKDRQPTGGILAACISVTMLAAPVSAQEATSDIPAPSHGEQAVAALESDPLQDQDMREAFDELGIPRSVQDRILTEAMAHLLTEGGLLPRTEEINQAIVLMDRQSRYSQAIQSMLSLLGPSAMVEVAPGEFANLEDTAAGYRARLIEIGVEEEVINAQRELRDAKLEQLQQQDRFDAEFRREVSREVAERIDADRERLLEEFRAAVSEIEARRAVSAANMESQARSDAEEILSRARIASAGRIAEAEETADALLASANDEQEIRARRIEQLEARIEQLSKPVEAVVAENSAPPFAVQEISGVSGRYQAVLSLPVGPVRVFPGDMLPGEIVIDRILSDRVEFRVAGGPRRVARY